MASARVTRAVIEETELRFAPVIELVGWRVTGGLATNANFLPNPIVSADGTNIVNLENREPGTSIGRHTSSSTWAMVTL